ncbi:MAG: TIGR03668 family PPOX class F420-dependent oxidoreductase, partial [Chloroflexi bacterium]|nr:TIGR03668 family PPOX class F420-dependent oxidoreductase [Chloroflexota bacterium]
NLAGNPKASLAAEHYEEDWDRVAWVRLDGTAEVFTSGGEHDEAVRLLRERYPQFNAKVLDGAPVIALRIERVLSFGPLDVVG